MELVFRFESGAEVSVKPENLVLMNISPEQSAIGYRADRGAIVPMVTLNGTMATPAEIAARKAAEEAASKAAAAAPPAAAPPAAAPPAAAPPAAAPPAAAPPAAAPPAAAPPTLAVPTRRSRRLPV